MAFPQSVADKALAACGRCCCICHKFCGFKMELHHIHQHADGGEDSFENCIPLCFDCHAEMGRGDPHHPKGKRYSEQELRMHRDNWYAQNGHASVVAVKMRNASGGHTVIIDDEKYIAEKVFEEHDEEILRLLKEI